MSKDMIEQLDLYQVTMQFINKEITIVSFNDKFLKIWNKLNQTKFWEKIDQKIIEEGNFNLYVDRYVIKAINVLFALIFEDIDIFDDDDDTEKLYQNTKKHLIKINQLLEILG